VPKHSDGGVKTLAAEGVGTASRGGAGRSNRHDGVDQEAAVQLRLVAAARATPRASGAREREERRGLGRRSV
jgi:hypothetical protein